MQSLTPRTRGTTSAPHSVRCAESLWRSASERAEEKGVTLNHALNELMEGYARGALELPPLDRAKRAFAEEARSSTHSVRCPDALWEIARQRAADSGLRMNDVLVSLLFGYSQQLMDLPRIVKTWSPTRHHDEVKRTRVDAA